MNLGVVGVEQVKPNYQKPWYCWVSLRFTQPTFIFTALFVS